MTTATTEPTVPLAALDALEAPLAAHRRLAELEDEITEARLGIEEAKQALDREIEIHVDAHMKAARWGAEG